MNEFQFLQPFASTGGIINVHDHMNKCIEKETNELQGLCRLTPCPRHEYDYDVVVDLKFKIRHSTAFQEIEDSIKKFVILRQVINV